MSFADLGFAVFEPEAATLRWADAARASAQAVLSAPGADRLWDCDGTWCVGVDLLPNSSDGAVAGVPLEGRGIVAARELSGPLPLHHAQVSVLRPGYPRPRDGEGDAAFRYRVNRDGAHVDGLLPEGPERRRHLREPHAWILGIALSDADPDASPLTVWEGSHRCLGPALSAPLADVATDALSDVDLTEAYWAARREVFETCTRRTIPLARGACVLLHRHLLHGIAPWAAGARADPMGRAVAYFRPQLSDGGKDWLHIL